jgi:hypothetical protein
VHRQKGRRLKSRKEGITTEVFSFSAVPFHQPVQKGLICFEGQQMPLYLKNSSK